MAKASESKKNSEKGKSTGKSQSAGKQDILSLIEADHDKIEQLFQEAEGSSGNKAMQQCFEQIYRELSIHAMAEELTFYPALRESEDTEQYIEEAEEEHNSAKILLEEMKHIGIKDKEFKTKLANLKQAVLHHVDEEEGEIFDAVRQVMGDSELQDLGQEFQEAKAKVSEDVEQLLANK